MTLTDREYAEALFSLATENGNAEEYGTHLTFLEELIEKNPGYLEFLSTPALPVRERLQGIEDAFSKTFPEPLVSFLKLLCENGHIGALTECIKEYHRLLRTLSNTAQARIISAVALEDPQKIAVCNKLERLCGKKIEPTYEIDPSILGGLKIELEGRTLDGSVKHRLQEVKDVIIG